MSEYSGEHLPDRFDEEDELDALLRKLLASSCCEQAPEEVKRRLVRRFQSYRIEANGVVHYVESYEERRE